MVEPEVAFNDSDDNMRLQEDFVSYVVARAVERRQPELKELERDVSKLENIKPPFPAHRLWRGREDPPDQGQLSEMGRRPRCRRRIAARGGTRSTGLHLQLSKGSESVLHEGEPCRSADCAVR